MEIVIGTLIGGSFLLWLLPISGEKGELSKGIALLGIIIGVSMLLLAVFFDVCFGTHIITHNPNAFQHYKLNGIRKIL